MKIGNTFVPLPFIFVLAILAVVILIVGGIALALSNEQRKMTPVATSQVTDDVYALNNNFVNLYLVKGLGGYIAVDAGVDADLTKQLLDDMGIAPEEVTAVLLTHSDRDHTASIGVFPNAQVYISEQEVQMIDGTTKRNPLGGNKLETPYKTLGDGETLELDGVSIKCILTPGHTPGSMCYLIKEKYLFTGDSMSLKEGKAGLFNAVYNMDGEEQARSIEKLARIIKYDYIFTGHYGYTKNTAALDGWE